jgi:hypothetical protein
VKKISYRNDFNARLRHRYFYAFIILTNCLTISLLIITIVQMAFFDKYSKLLLIIGTYVTHLSTLVFLFFLIFMFIDWFRSKKNYIIILYSLSFSLIFINVILSLIYLEYYYSRSLISDIRPYPIHSYVITLSSPAWSQFLGTIFNINYVLSFLVIWTATILLLKQYAHKLGRIKYVTLIGIPLIYYLFPLESYFGNIFSQFQLTSPVTFGIIYVLTFSATKQVGALLFSLAFWTASGLVTRDNVRKSLLISAIGLAILFGSINIDTLRYKIFPPFGLITQAFMPLGSYLLFVGVLASAKNVSNDADLRKEFYNNAKSQLNLLKTIGVIQMEKELVKRYKSMEKYSSQLEIEEEPYSEEDNVKEIVRDVLNELYSKAKDETKNEQA